MSTLLSDNNLKDLSCLSALFFDIDDTLSTDGKLTSEAYSSLWKLKNKGIALIPVTGRPAGWCDHIIRFWPVDAVIGENGAFTFYMDGIKRARLDTLGSKQNNSRSLLDRLKVEIKSEFPNAIWASDQDYREYDLAIDVCEDVAPWSRSEIERLLKFCKQKGAKAKISSIHVNTWFGDFDKATGINYWLKQGSPGLPFKLDFSNVAFVGDSPNDEPMFELFQKSIGVANINNYLHTLEHKPKWITKSKSGSGFCELAEMILKAT